MGDNISIVENCIGCTLCISICSHHAIKLASNIEGYIRPQIDIKKCIKCSYCLEKCPVNNPDYANSYEPQCYVVSADENIRSHSSSGGAFEVFAKKIFSLGGVVFGAKWDKNNQVYIGNTAKESALKDFNHSKYVYSEPRLCYKNVKQHLVKGTYVLFSGLPCQIAALNKYLGRKYLNLLTVEVLCGGAPSPKNLYYYLKDLKEIYHCKSISIEFRDDGKWDPHIHSIYGAGQKKIPCSRWTDDPYQIAYHSTLLQSDACKRCKFSILPRQADITIGDCWGIEKIITPIEKNRGYSIIIANNISGQNFLTDTISKFEFAKPLNLSDVLNMPNRINSKNADYYLPSDVRTDFSKIITKFTFKKSVEYALQRKIDVGIVTTFSRNYGGNLTYYSLYQVLSKLGYTSIFIERRLDTPCPPHKNPLYLFRNNPYPIFAIAPIPSGYEQISAYNSICNCFMVGSDQMWHPTFIRDFGKHTCMDWVHADKLKIAYATSFGKDKFENWEQFPPETQKLLSRFDAISVRESSAVKILSDVFNIHSTRVLDPVFLCDSDVFTKLANKSIHSTSEKYIFAYILNPCNSIFEKLNEIVKIQNLKVILVKDPYVSDDLYEKYNYFPEKDVKVEDWLYYLMNCELVFSDSFHGACFSIIFDRPFVLYINSIRGSTRIDTLAELFPIKDYLINNDTTLNFSLIGHKIDYNIVEKILSRERKQSIEWLVSALNISKEPCCPDSTDREILCTIENDKKTLEYKNKIKKLKEESKQSDWFKIKLIDELLDSKKESDHQQAYDFAMDCYASGNKCVAGKIASMYLNGLGVKKDLKQARKYLKEAADGGSEWARIELVSVLMNSDDDVDKVLAFDLCKSYIDSGTIKLYGKLAIMYKNGIGVDKSINECLKYLHLAEKNGNEWAKKELKNLNVNSAL